jgi:hypothetical protein
MAPGSEPLEAGRLVVSKKESSSSVPLVAGGPVCAHSSISGDAGRDVVGGRVGDDMMWLVERASDAMPISACRRSKPSVMLKAKIGISSGLPRLKHHTMMTNWDQLVSTIMLSVSTEKEACDCDWELLKEL